MTSSLNLSNVTIGENGKVTVSGLSSGLDSAAIIDAAVSARRIQAAQIEVSISENTQKVSDYTTLKELSTTFAENLDTLRGSTSYFATDVFESKTGYYTSSASDDAAQGHIATDPSQLLSASITEDAVAGDYVVEIEQVAKAQSLRSDAFSSKTDALVNDLGFTGGVININGTDITVSNTDTLLDLRDAINNADLGASATIVSASDTEHYLVLTSEDTGVANEMTIASNAAPTSITLNNSGFETQVLADGGTSTAFSDWAEKGTDETIINPTSSTLSSIPEGNNVLRVGTNGAVAQTTSEVIAADTFYTLTADVAQAIGSSGGNYRIQIYDDNTSTMLVEQTGTVAAGDEWNEVSVVLDGNDFVGSQGNNIRVRLISDSGEIYFDDIKLESTTSGAAESLGFLNDATVKNELSTAQDAQLTVNGITGVTRSSNNIDDVVEGVTLNLLQAEVDTEITLTVETDLDTVKTALTEFVSAYNALRDFYDDQKLKIDRDETVDADGDGDATNDESFGSLANDPTLRALMSKVNGVITQSKSSLEDGFQSLSQIGITMTEDFKLEIDDSELDNRLLTNVDEVRKLFVAEVTSTDSRVNYVQLNDSTQEGTYYLSIEGTDADGNILGGRISDAPGAGTSNDGSFSVNGNGITASDVTNAEGLNVIFNAGASSGAIADVQLTVSRGLADQMYYYLNELTQLDGTIDDLNENLTERNTDLEEQVATIDARLVTYRTTLETKYLAMETALAELENLQSTIDSYFNSDDS